MAWYIEWVLFRIGIILIMEINKTVQAIIRAAKMRAIVERMLPIVDDKRYPESLRKRAEKVMSDAASLAASSEKELS
jgi:hypothetical protein